MARMDFSFDTNLPDSVDDKQTVQVENITFKTQSDNLSITIRCGRESDFGVINGVYNARFKGLEYHIEDKDGNTLVDWEEEIDDKYLEELITAEIESISFYYEDNFNIPKGFTPVCANLGVSISHSTKECDHSIELFKEGVPIYDLLKDLNGEAFSVLEKTPSGINIYIESDSKNALMKTKSGRLELANIKREIRELSGENENEIGKRYIDLIDGVTYEISINPSKIIEYNKLLELELEYIMEQKNKSVLNNNRSNYDGYDDYDDYDDYDR